MATVQIRNLDDETYAVLKTRAAASGRSLQEYLRLLLVEQASKDDRRDFWKRYRADMAWSGIRISAEEIVEMIHEGREER